MPREAGSHGQHWETLTDKHITLCQIMQQPQGCQADTSWSFPFLPPMETKSGGAGEGFRKGFFSKLSLLHNGTDPLNQKKMQLIFKVFETTVELEEILLP